MIKINNLQLKRCFAFIIDLVIVNLIFVQPLMFKVQKILPENVVELSLTDLQTLLENNPAIMHQLNQLSMIAIGLILAYFILLEYFTHQTIGQYLLKLKVIASSHLLIIPTRDQKKHLKPTLLQIAARNLCLLPLFPFILLWIVEPIWLFWKKRTLLDHYTNTTIVDANPQNGKV